MANSAGSALASVAAKLPARKRSGATYNRRSSPRTAARSRSARSSGPIELLMYAAATPRAVSASTWSFMSEMSGETTTTSFCSATAGSW